MVIRRADTLIYLQWFALVLTLTLFYTLFGQNKITIGQKNFAFPKIGTPARISTKCNLVRAVRDFQVNLTLFLT